MNVNDLAKMLGDASYGFLTLTVYAPDGDAEELIVPIGVIKRISLGPADEARHPGFALPKGKGPEPAA